MAVLQHPTTGAVIHASGGLASRLLAQGWINTDQPPAPGLRLVTAIELEAATIAVGAVQSNLDAAFAMSVSDRADLRSILEPIAEQVPQVAAEVDDLAATIEAPDPQTAPKPTPRTDALEAWRADAEPVVDGLHPVATSGSYNDLANKPALNFDPSGSAASAQAAAVQRANHTGTQPAASVTGLHAVATSGDYNALSNKPTIPAAVNVRGVVVSSAALTANTAKTLPVSWPSAMPSATYAVQVTVEHATPQQFNVSLLPGSKTTAGCSVVVRSTAAVSAPGVNVQVTATA